MNTDCLAQSGKEPATVREAAKTINLEKFEAFGESPSFNHKGVAAQSYVTGGSVDKLAERILSALKSKGFVEAGEASITPDYAYVGMSKDGFLLSVLVSQSGEAGRAMVNIQNLGNVQLGKLPVPADCKSLYALPNVSAYITEQSVEEATKASKRLFAEAGWVPYGSTTVGFFVKKHAVRVQAFISSAPAQDNKTMIQLSSEMMSVDLPAPADASRVDYSESTKALFVSTSATQDSLVDFYQKALGASGWKPTTDKPLRVGLFDHLIFRNADKELIDIEFKSVDGETQALVDFQSADEVAADDEQAKLAVEKANAEKAAGEKMQAASIRSLEFDDPAGATLKDGSETNCTYSIASGKAKTAVQSLLKAAEAKGWKITTNVDEGIVGDYGLNLDEAEVHVTFTDPGFGPAEIEISAFSKSTLARKPR